MTLPDLEPFTWRMSSYVTASSVERQGQAVACTAAASETSAPRNAFLIASTADHQLHMSLLSSHSTLSSTPSLPLTPASSIKGHSRFPSSSTLASSPPVRASMDSYLSKRPLAQLREHPQERALENGEDFGQDSADQFQSFPSISRHTRTSSHEEPPIDYDWIENLPFDEPTPITSLAKRRRADKSTPSMLSTKIASRFPSLSRRFRSRSEKRSSSITDGLSLHDSFRSRSRTSSMRSAPTRDSSLDIPDRRDPSMMPTPRTSFIQEEPTSEDEAPIQDVLEEEEEEEDKEEAEDGSNSEQPIEHPGLSPTPLLPPVLAMHANGTDPVQSPLQSPKVAGTPAATTPPSPYQQPTGSGMPSPPLSTRPSVASFHHRQTVSSPQIAPIALGSPEGPTDEWALRLGHENFFIQPEPYLPPAPTLEACRQLKADWEQAEREFGRHLARTRANYSATSNIAQLTEQKWAQINGLWMAYHTQALEAATKVAGQQKVHWEEDILDEQGALSKQSSLHEPVPMAQIPRHLVGGKFPSFGDAGIVGPMEVVKPTAVALRASKGRKRGFWRFLQDLIPGNLASSRV